MMTRLFCILVLAGASLAVRAEVLGGNSERGARLFETQQCVRCHGGEGKQRGTAPDLRRRIGRNYSPAMLASILWNHAPAMWSEMDRQGIPVPSFSRQDAADLFAYFYSARFFDRPGDAARGKDAFSRHHCADCHGLTQPKPGKAPAVAQWRALSSPAALVEAMWNHAQGMHEEFARRGFRWPELTSQDLTDILVYLRNYPGIPRRQDGLEVTPGDGGESLLQQKGCLKCHQGALALGPRLRGKTIEDVAVAMWNHSSKMTAAVGTFQPGEMQSLLSYLWTKQILQTDGDVAHGRKAFRQKSCAGCHAQGQAPRLTGQFDAVRMTAALWSHGPNMWNAMQKQGIRWPRLTAADMAGLIAYLNSGR